VTVLVWTVDDPAWLPRLEAMGARRRDHETIRGSSEARLPGAMRRIGLALLFVLGFGAAGGLSAGVVAATGTTTGTTTTGTTTTRSPEDDRARVTIAGVDVGDLTAEDATAQVNAPSRSPSC
jgi:hypothetical protein